MKSIAGCFALIFIFALNTPAQVLENGGHKQKDTYIFHNHTYPDTLLYNTSYIIQELAIGNGLSQSEAEFRLLYETFLEVREKPGDKRPVLGILLKDIVGQITYKGFNIHELLFPNGLRFEVKELRNNRVIDTHEIIFPALDRYDTNWILLNSKLFEYTERIKIDKVKFYFDEAGKQELLEMFTLINDYYASAQIIDSIILEAGKMPFGEVTEFGKALIFLFEIDKIKDQLKQKEFLEVLPLKYKDPGNIRKHYRELELLHKRVKTLTGESLESYPDITQEIIEDAFDFYISMQQKYIRWSAEAGHKTQAFFLQLLVKQYNAADIAVYNDYLERLKAEKFKSFAYKNFFANNHHFIDQCIERQSYMNALAVLKSITSMSMQVPAYADRDLIRKQKSRAIHGLFHSYLRVADRAIGVRNFSLANEYLARASSFQKNNSHFIISDIEVKNTMQSLIDGYILSASEKIDTNNYDDALQLLADARKQSKSHNIFLNVGKVDSLMNVAREGIFQHYLAMAAKNFNKGNYAIARAYLDKAEKYNHQENNFSVNPPLIGDLPEYETYIGQARAEIARGNFESALNILQVRADESLAAEHHTEREYLETIAAEKLAARLISKTEGLIYNHKEKSAEQAIKRAESLINTYDIRNEQLNTELEFARSALWHLSCKNKLTSYNQLTDRGVEAANKFRYTDAVALLKQANRVLNDLHQCTLSDSIQKIEIARYEKAAKYQEKLSLLKNALYEKGFSEVINQYLRLENYYRVNDLSGLGLNHLGLEEFLRRQENPALIKASFEHFFTRDNCQKSLRMLDLLQEIKYPASKSRKMQKRLAGLCFNRHGKASDLYPKKDNRWFNAFRTKLFFLNLIHGVKSIFPKSENSTSPH